MLIILLIKIRKNIKEIKIQKKFDFKDKILDPYPIFAKTI